MKINGRVFTVPHTITTVIPRQDGNVVFTATAVLDFSAFEALCPQPQPPVVTPRGQSARSDVTDREYLGKMAEWLGHRFDWIAVQSLSATTGLEWESIVANDPKTWGNWRGELQKACFTIPEINRIYTSVQQANALDDKYIEAARESFSQGEQLRLSRLSSQSDEPKNTPSGSPVKE